VMLLFSLHRLEQLLSCFCQLFEDPVLSGLPTRSIIQTNTQFLKMRVQLSTALFLVACGVTSAFAPTATNSVCRNNLNNVPLFMSTEAASLNGADVADVEIPTKLPSDVGMDYVPLATMLATGQLAEADQFTRDALIVLAGSKAKGRDFVYFTEVKNIPSTDLATIERLWNKFSGGKFGYSVQKVSFLRALFKYSAL